MPSDSFVQSIRDGTFPWLGVFFGLACVYGVWDFFTGLLVLVNPGREWWFFCVEGLAIFALGFIGIYARQKRKELD